MYHYSAMQFRMWLGVTANGTEIEPRATLGRKMPGRLNSFPIRTFVALYGFNIIFILFSRYLTKAFYIWAKQDKFSCTLINNLISHTDTEHSAPAWMVLAKVAISAPKLDYTKVLNTWEDISR